MKWFKRLLRPFAIDSNYYLRAFTIPRAWSNQELAKFADRYTGAIVNVSAWEDKDKFGGVYRDYFSNCSSYSISNFGTSQGTLQGTDNEFFLDLERELPAIYAQAFDVVFNHTTLEHTWNFQLAMKNLCAMSRDTVILVTPWLQPVHSDYGDYWRFSPSAVVRLFLSNGFTTHYLSWNESPMASVYVFSIATRDTEKWRRFSDFRSVNAGIEALHELPAHAAGKAAFDWKPLRTTVTRRLHE